MTAQRLATVPAVQRLTINDWVPEAIANGPHGHWSTKRRKLQQAKVAAHAGAVRAGWQLVTTRARLDVTLVFPQNRRRDTDNLYSRCKGLVDGLKSYIVDDSTEWLDLHVSARVERGATATELVLTALEDA